jgi:peptide/nickel transport system permease protein
MRAVLARLFARPAPRAAALALAALVLAALAAPLVELALSVRHDLPDLSARRCPAGYPHLLGCDEVGQDVLVRLLYGARISLVVGLGAALLSTLLGTAVGVVSGAVGGRLDGVAMRIVDAMLAIPVLPLLLLASAMAIGTPGGGASGSVAKLVVILGLFGWMGVARVARAETLRLIELDFVVAARALGARWPRVLARHVLPNALPPVLVAATIDVGRNILAEAALSFLGLGVQPPTPSWGNMLRHAEDAIQSDPALAFWPGSCILLAVVCVTVLGEALRAALDPRSAVAAPSPRSV